MSAKNSKPQSKKSRGELRKQLARDIASILANPECPVDLYNDIAENVVNWSTDYCNLVNETPEYIHNCLEAHLATEEKRKGGTR
jgi:hypothetical protein